MPEEDEKAQDKIEDTLPMTRSAGRRVALVVGCLAGVAFAILVTALAIMLLRARNVASPFLKGDIDEVIKSSPLDDDEKARAQATIQQFVDLAAEEKIPREKVEVFLWRFAQGRLSRMLTLHRIRKAVDESTLSDGRKAEAGLNLDKLAAALARDDLTEDEYGQMKNAMPKESDGSPRPPPWSDDEIKKLADTIARLVRDTQAPASTSRTYYAEELRNVIRSMKEEIAEAEDKR